MALELFLSEELGPITVIRAPPSPGYAGDWVKFNSAFFFFFSHLTSVSCNYLQGKAPAVPLPGMPSSILHTFSGQWGLCLRPPYALFPIAKWCLVALTSFLLHPGWESLDSRGSKSLGCPAKQEHKQQQQYFKYFTKSYSPTSLPRFFPSIAS